LGRQHGLQSVTVWALAAPLGMLCRKAWHRNGARTATGRTMKRNAEWLGRPYGARGAPATPDTVAEDGTACSDKSDGTSARRLRANRRTQTEGVSSDPTKRRPHARRSLIRTSIIADARTPTTWVLGANWMQAHTGGSTGSSRIHPARRPRDFLAAKLQLATGFCSRRRALCTRLRLERGRTTSRRTSVVHLEA